MRRHTAVSGFGQLPYEKTDSAHESVLDVMMYTAEEVANWGAEQNFIRQQRLQIGRLLKPFVPADAGTGFGAEEECHLMLGQMCAFAMCADVIGQFRGRHGLDARGSAMTAAGSVCYTGGNGV